MALGALIGAYQEGDAGLRALLPLAGRTLVEYQARCAAAAGAAPIVVLVERVPASLNDAFERLRQEGIAVIAVSDGVEAATRFGAGELILMIGDGVAAPVELLARLADEPGPAIATVPDDPAHEDFERIDASSRWAGVAIVDAPTLSSTAAMLGDWDLQSTLLRRVIQEGAAQIPTGEALEPLQAWGSQDLAGFERKLIVASRGARRDWASRYVLPIAEDLATERLIESRVRPEWLVRAALGLTLIAAFAFTRGWLWPALALLIISTPLDLVGRRIAVLRLRPLDTRMLSRRLLWPAAGLALLALGWWISRHGGGWGAFLAAVTAAAFAEAGRAERGSAEMPFQAWLFSRRNAILGTVPFAAAGAWTAALVALAVYAGASFFAVQHVRHRLRVD